ncbi:MAG: HRDC domain-containing protein [Myxococcota bacterium]|nr:HRDC domain-containing protein [Myxococcota bacterium]
MADFEIIERESELEALAADLLKEKVVAVDTEADSFYHYFDKTCLIQIATRKRIYLVDPLAMDGAEKLAPLGPLFASPDVCVLFHAAEYDIFVLKRDYGFEFANLFDTMVSAQLLGYRAVGLAALIEHHFGLKLPKDEQRSDWSRRPLTAKQLDYAASDVKFLIRLSEKLGRELRKAKRLEWAEAEFESLTQRRWPERSFDELGYLRIKGARKLESKSLSILRELHILRDRRAREIDRPPFKVLGNRTLIQIAQDKPRSLAALGEIKGVTELILRRMGSELMSAVRDGRKQEHGPIPKLASNGRRRMDRRSEKRLEVLKKWRQRRAAELELDPGVLCPNASLEAIASKPPIAASDLEGRKQLKGWFARAFGEEIAELLADDDDRSGKDTR